MKVGKPIAVVLVVVISGGVMEKLVGSALDGTGHDSTAISADAGPFGGTIVAEQPTGGYIALGPRQRVEPTARRAYLGGSISDYWFS
jgi:hypothetical protein